MINPLKNAVCCFCISLIVFLVGCEQNQDDGVSAPLRQVRSIIVETGSGIVERSFSGTLQSSNQTSYSFKVSGTIRAIPVEVGQAVASGDIIATLDPSDYELEVQKAQALLTEARSENRNAKAEYERSKKLYEAGNSSRSDLDNARAAAETTTAATQSALKSLQIAQQDLSYTQLKSQEACKIAAISGDSGENIQQGQEIVVATCGEDLEVKLNIPESIIANIKKDMNADIAFPAIPGKTYAGLVKEVGVAAVDGGTTFPVDVLITTADKTDLKSGLSADVSFSIDNRTKGATALPILPSFAVGEDQNGRFVFVVELTEKNQAFVKRVPVIIGELQQQGIEIAQGVEPGMRVVTAGVSVLRDGMEVKVAD
ncbi:MAG: efflux RND transporter periplasmic adaptor subunit [Pseudomonadota bacterium]